MQTREVARRGGETRASAVNFSYRHWPVCRYQYGVPAICREGRPQSDAVASCCQPAYGRTFSCPHSAPSRRR
ncbi:hypothetical protein SMD44_08806 [Streptomyces alboflavus]|uniref:Uncharacterized protein n=1 Tax=Streptomyces alboflavus TaxID=67267 RepID=A0A1Z1WSF5_9ACTN|nr:hypothetical protein SMD44_08806 [Streptomyces alboflavus]